MTTEISNKISPKIRAPIEISTEGKEKFPNSEKLIIAIPAKIIPTIIKIKPGIPKNFNG